MDFVFARTCRWTMTGLLAASLLATLLRAETGDADNSHDYPGFPRMSGDLISDYDEDNPAEFTFTIARPLPIDLNRVEKITVKGHRYIIRYEPGADGKTHSLLETQKAYEKLAADGGYKLEKTGAVGDVTETFHLTKNGRETWVSLQPGGSFTVLTVVESASPPAVKAPVLAPPLKPLVTGNPPPSAPPPKPAVTKPAAPAPPPSSAAAPQAVSAAKPNSSAPSVATAPGEDSFYAALIKEGRVVLPLAFLPGKPDLDADSKPVIDRVAAMMQRHPDLRLEIDGHTDNTGSAEANQHLSEQRAVAVKGMLVSEKIDRRRLMPMGFGGSQPLVKEGTAEGREKNRRIELVLLKPDEAPVPAEKIATPQKIPAKLAPKTPKNETPPKSSSDDSMVQEGSPHGMAPNGVNYYPATSTSK